MCLSAALYMKVRDAQTNADHLPTEAGKEGDTMRYRYPFIQSASASWVARCIRPAVEQEEGRVEVQGRYSFVTLPDAIRPESIGQLSFFMYDQVQDNSGIVVQRITLGNSTAA